VSALTRPAHEIADVIRRYGHDFLATHGPRLPAAQKLVLPALVRCRTAALGGHLERCDNPACRHQRPAYNSCRNRHRPKCGAQAQARWVQARLDRLLPVPYFHVVFTLPQALAELALQNQRLLYGLFFRAAAGALRSVADNPQHWAPGSASSPSSTPGAPLGTDPGSPPSPALRRPRRWGLAGREILGPGRPPP